MELIYGDMLVFIYKIINIVNGKVYIGQTRRKYLRERFAHHKSKLRKNDHCNVYLQRSWNKHGEDNFNFELICTVKSIEQLNKKEKYFIQKYNSCNRNFGYNLQNGGHNYVCNDETKEKIRVARKGKPLGPQSESHKKKIGDANRKRVWKSTSKQKVSKHLKEWHSGEEGQTWKLEMQKKLSKTYPGVISPTGIVYEKIINLREFCRQHNLHRCDMLQLFKGKYKQCKGWTLLNVSI